VSIAPSRCAPHKVGPFEMHCRTGRTSRSDDRSIAWRSGRHESTMRQPSRKSAPSQLTGSSLGDHLSWPKFRRQCAAGCLDPQWGERTPDGRRTGFGDSPRALARTTVMEGAGRRLASGASRRPRISRARKRRAPPRADHGVGVWLAPPHRVTGVGKFRLLHILGTVAGVDTSIDADGRPECRSITLRAGRR
jgi:hypothetical protein